MFKMVNTTNKSTTIKKSPVKKEASTKTTMKKAPVKKTVSAKTTVKKAPVKKEVSTKTTVKKSPVKKTVATKTTVKKAPVKKTVATKINKNGIISKLLSNFGFIKNNLLDIGLLYKNILHWNLSKFLIFIWSIILGFISIIPLVIIFFIYAIFSEVSLDMLINGMFSGTLLSNLFGNILLLLIVVVYVIIFSYSNLLLIRLNNSYAEGKKLSLKNNDYFNYKKIIKFFNLSLLNIFILFIPVILFLILMGVLYLVSGGYDQSNFSGGINYFVVLSFSFFVICGVSIVYLYYRIIFSYFVLGDDKYYDKSKSALSYIKESFAKTKGLKNFFKLFAIVFIIVVIIAPIEFVGEVIEKNDYDLTNYHRFLNAGEEGKAYLTSNNSIYYQGLDLQFQGMSNEDIVIMLNKNNIYLLLFTVFNFIFLYGLFIMVLSSFYKRELK